MKKFTIAFILGLALIAGTVGVSQVAKNMSVVAAEPFGN